MIRKYILFISILFSLAACQQGVDSSDPLVHADDVILVEVDGRAVSLPMLEFLMSQRGVAEGDHEGMRALLEELIRLRAVANAAEREGLADQPAVRAERALRDMEALQLQYFTRIHEQFPVSDEDVRQTYQAQLARSGDRQFRLETIVYPGQSEALLAIAALQDGEVDFAALVDQASSAARAVETTGWVDRSQVGEELAPLLSGSDPGDILATPLRTPQGWRVVRVGEARPIEAPDLESVREGIARQLVRQRLEALVEDLYEAAQITPMLPLEDAAAN